MRLHSPSSSACRAALTAKATSSLSPSATWQMDSSVAGFTVANVLPLAASTHSLLIKHCVFSILGVAGLSVTVAMSLSCKDDLRVDQSLTDNPDFAVVQIRASKGQRHARLCPTISRTALAAVQSMPKTGANALRLMISGFNLTLRDRD